MGLKLVIGMAGNRQDSDAEMVYLGNDATAQAEAMASNTTSRFFILVANPQYVGVRKNNPGFGGEAPATPQTVGQRFDQSVGQRIDQLLSENDRDQLVQIAEPLAGPVPDDATPLLIAMAIIAAQVDPAIEETAQDDDQDDQGESQGDDLTVEQRVEKLKSENDREGLETIAKSLDVLVPASANKTEIAQAIVTAQDTPQADDDQDGNDNQDGGSEPQGDQGDDPTPDAPQS